MRLIFVFVVVVVAVIVLLLLFCHCHRRWCVVVQLHSGTFIESGVLARLNNYAKYHQVGISYRFPFHSLSVLLL